MSTSPIVILKRLGILVAVVLVAFGILSLFTYDVIKPEWISFMKIQPSFKPMEDPLPVPERSIPVDGPISIPNMGAPDNPVPADDVSVARGRELFGVAAAQLDVGPKKVVPRGDRVHLQRTCGPCRGTGEARRGPYPEHLLPSRPGPGLGDGRRFRICSRFEIVTGAENVIGSVNVLSVITGGNNKHDAFADSILNGCASRGRVADPTQTHVGNFNFRRMLDHIIHSRYQPGHVA